MHETPLPHEVARALRSGGLTTDRIFDGFLPLELRAVSGQFWTPLLIAVQAARWLRELEVRSVADIGSGAGKFCVIAHLAAGFRCFGLEQRDRLIAAARQLAAVFEVERQVTFLHGALGSTPLPEVDAYYMYNPFGENLFGREDHLDEDVELGPARYERDLAAVELLLNQARVGTYLLTYNGFGTDAPSSYALVRTDHAKRNPMQLWRKLSAAGG